MGVQLPFSLTFHNQLHLSYNLYNFSYELRPK